MKFKKNLLQVVKNVYTKNNGTASRSRYDKTSKTCTVTFNTRLCGLKRRLKDEMILKEFSGVVVRALRSKNSVNHSSVNHVSCPCTHW